VGETRVDLVHLLEDLRDAYPGGLEETILTEIVANALDSGASCIHLATDPAGASFTAVDDGSGMRRRELARYHDVAASTKARGDGIGFAGVGIKLGLLVCEEVLTESRRGKTHVASRWHLASRHRAPCRCGRRMRFGEGPRCATDRKRPLPVTTPFDQRREKRGGLSRGAHRRPRAGAARGRAGE